jgi:RNA polymerase sigma-70 factor (ECF subfamily)
MEYHDEQELIQSVLDGNIQAYAVLLQRYQRPIFSMIFQMVGNREDAEELTQDVFVKVYTKLSTFKAQCRFSTWAYRIAYTTTVSSLRKRRVTYPDVDESLLVNYPDEHVDDYLEQEEGEAKLKRLEAAMNKLMPEEQALISLFYNEGKSVLEIADILDLSVENVKVRLHRIRKKVVILVEKETV